MSLAEQTPEPHLTVPPPAEAARRARPLPSDDDMALGDVADEEWDPKDVLLHVNRQRDGNLGVRALVATPGTITVGDPVLYRSFEGE